VIHALVVGAGKDSNIYLANRSNMGKFNPNNNSQLYQELPVAIAGPVFRRRRLPTKRIYYGGVDDTIKAFSFNASACWILRLRRRPVHSSTIRALRLVFSGVRQVI